MQLAQAVGIDPKTVSYVSYDGGGELLPALLGNKIAFGASGFGEFLDQVEAGDVRVLAVTSAERVDALKDVPTLKEKRHRPRVHQLARRRGASRHLRGGQAGLDRRLHPMHDIDAWKAELEKRGWVDAFATGEEFGDLPQGAGHRGRRRS